MKIIVIPREGGLVSDAGRIVGQELPDGALLVDAPFGGLELQPHKAALVRDGALVVLENWIGSGPWYDQKAALDARETPHKIDALGIVPPNDLGRQVSPGWENMAMTPRPLTKAEIAAQKQAAESAAAAAEAERIGQMSVTDVQFGLACIAADIITADEAEAWVARGVLPAALATAIDTLPENQRPAARIKAAGERVFVRSSPFVVALGAAMGKTPAQIDALFDAASNL